MCRVEFGVFKYCVGIKFAQNASYEPNSEYAI
jgi:hypothetical protein